MIKHIKYNGYTTSPSDYECPDGDLSNMIGLATDNGSLVPIDNPKAVLTLTSGKVVFIHKMTYVSNFIVRTTTGAIQYKSGTSGTLTDLPSVTFTSLTFHQVNAIGNTLIVLTSSGIHYFLWKSNSYTYLGNHIPELSLSFGLQGNLVYPDTESVTGFYTEDVVLIPETVVSNGGSLPSDDARKVLTNSTFGLLNRFIAQQIESGKFIHPFFIRYAYRLYDGSLIMHSQPIFMDMDSIVAFVTHYTTVGEWVKSFTLWAHAIANDIDYAAVSSSQLTALANWKDIVKSVDIFISAPIYYYDQSADIRSLSPFIPGKYYSICKKTGSSDYKKNTIADFGLLHSESDILDINYYAQVDINRYDRESIQAKIESQNNFYLLTSISIDNITTTRTKISVPTNYLSTIVNRELMSDDYDSHDTLYPKFSFTYNSRLNVTDIRKSIFPGFHPRSCSIYASSSSSVSFYFFIRDGQKEIVTHTASATNAIPNGLIYHPNPNAYKVVVQIGSTCYAIPMHRHDFLNGSVSSPLLFNANTETSVPTASSDLTIEIPNKIYTSEVDNPFYFPARGINTIGTSKVMALSTAAKALSQGQFGQFPLYAFTTEGVWALELADNGLYKAVQPITRDVCINADSICQIDSSVVFATARGIMHLSGSSSECISDNIDSADLFQITDLPAALSILGNNAGYTSGVYLPGGSTVPTTTPAQLNVIPFKDYIQNCGIIYSYTLQRIIVYNPTKSYAYVYSMKSHTWGMMKSSIKSSFPSYPEAYAMIGTTLFDYSQTDSSTNPNTAITGSPILVTRPLKLDHPGELITVSEVVQRGKFQKGHVKSVLYGSRDLITWHLIWSSSDHYLRGFSGTPYIYFRILLICDLSSGESIDGCTVRYLPRFTHRLH
jgi:hypothetical protein